MIFKLGSQVHSTATTEVDIEKTQAGSELALIEILSKFHERINTITHHQMQGLETTSKELDRASHEFLEDLKLIFEAEKDRSVAKPLFKTLEYIASFITIALGVGLCSTGVASVVGSVMIGTGVFGCAHTTLELTDSYKKLAMHVEDKHAQEIIKKYLPAMVSTCLALSASISGAFSAKVALGATMRTINLFLPLILQSLQTAQVLSKGVFDLHRNRAEARKIDHEALGKCLETILQEQQQAMMNNMQCQTKMNKDALHTLKTLISLHKHF